MFGRSSAPSLLSKKTFRAAERDLERNKEKRRVYEEELAKVPDDKRVYVDEAGTNLGMSRAYSRSPEGQRAFSVRPASNRGNISLVAAVRLKKESVMYPFDGAVDGERFLTFLDEHLLKTLSPDDVVILDNVRFHHIAEVQERLKTVGAKALFLPPYSPELNPIEEGFSLVKSVFKSAEARTICAYIDALDAAKKSLTPEKIEAFFKHANSFLGKSTSTQSV